MDFLLNFELNKNQLLSFVNHWLEARPINNYKVAQLLCKLIPASCPFERDISLGEYTFHIPSLCKLNPFYESLIILRFRALNYITEQSSISQN